MKIKTKTIKPKPQKAYTTVSYTCEYCGVVYFNESFAERCELECLCPHDEFIYQIDVDDGDIVGRRRCLKCNKLIDTVFVELYKLETLTITDSEIMFNALNVIA